MIIVLEAVVAHALRSHRLDKRKPAWQEPSA